MNMVTRAASDYNGQQKKLQALCVQRWKKTKMSKGLKSKKKDENRLTTG